MKQKISLVIIAFVGLFLLFYWMEDHPENISETNFWKEDWKSIRYAPPKEDWCGVTEPKFAEESMVFRKIPRGWNVTPLYTVSLTKDGKEVSYEANYNVKNSFSELSVLKTKLIEKATPEIQKSYCLGMSSPSLSLSEESGTDIEFSKDKQLFFGKKIGADEGRVSVLVNDEVIAPYNYLIEKFRAPSISFREKMYVTFNEGYLRELSFSGQVVNVKAENRAKKNQYNVYVNDWSRTTGERIVLPPDVGNQWESVVKGLKLEFYRDEAGAPQFPELATTQVAEAVLDVTQSEGIKYRLSFFPLWESESGKWRPVRRELLPYFSESITWMKEESFQNLVNAVMKVKSASRYERPNQKIQ
ncbi:hypothetical protein EHQ23_14170 [Leptospira bourretii]|uniref:DUF4340 domain-containing protein n=1 Tax=Leptospira bourretii TaxID=2484962 RepID=A0A4R9IRG0_9LEPT|nr:hypothetical protein [Leptospira bourretii]TGK85769.1 hypothetical protein EHQ23_14170 [Leptospira bourretii]TGK94667.1 hypothetical protein EHQ26_01600 [Leptospira bourretii]TGL25023.1 hypothetical protein EHQ47_03530 [Leptospira bourretii]TGL38143.1 hypothetical protein EHQ45_04900 [Leptospira bourretii]